MSTFHHSREIPSSPEAVFDAFKNPERLSRWWGPDGFSSSFYTFEFYPGGQWLFTMHGPDGVNYPNQSEFLEIIPNSLIRLRHSNLPNFELSISLKATATGTLVSWSSDFENKAFAERMRDFLENANEQNLNRLAEELSHASA